jgi:hypothetical protein
MSIDEDIARLKRTCDRLSTASEAGCVYYLLEGLQLPQGCSPSKLDALLCIGARDGYQTRLYLSERVETAAKIKLNWNANGVRIMERNWCAFSWNVPAALGPASVLDEHLKALV